jgi:hypothetical protein
MIRIIAILSTMGSIFRGDRSTTYAERAADCKLARLRRRPSQSLAGRHPPWSQRQTSAALPAGVVLPVQSPQSARRSGSLSDPARCRMRHHHLRSAHSRPLAGRCLPCPPPSRNSWATCFRRIGIHGISRCLTINFTDSRAILNIFDTKAIVISTRQNPTNYPRTPLLGCC